MQLFVNATLIDGNEYRSKYTVFVCSSVRAGSLFGSVFTLMIV